jgi:hypothetical protein
VLNTIKGLLAITMIAVIIGLLVIAFVDGFINHDQREITPAWVVSGTKPSQVSMPETRNKRDTLAYRMAAGQSVSSTFAIPRLKQTWMDRHLGGNPHYVLDGRMHFQPDKACAATARLTWRLHTKTGRLPLTHEVWFNELDVPTNTVTVTARLDASAPCAGVMRLIFFQVTNQTSSTGKAPPAPTVTTTPK